MKRIVLALCAVAVLVPGSARAATFAVTSTADAVDTAVGDGICATAASACTLRAAVQEANASAGADTITVPSGTYRLTLTGSDDASAVGDLDIASPLTLTGAGPSATILDADGIDRYFDVRAAFSLSGVTVTHGSGSGLKARSVPVTVTNATFASNANQTGNGGGIDVSLGLLTLTSVTITGNSASASGGGLASGSLTASGIVVRDNVAADEGGGIFLSTNVQTVSIADSVVSGNESRSGLGGGGIRSLMGSSTLTIAGSELSDNRATGTSTNGGGIASNTPVTIVNSTISGNSSTGIGGGAYLWGGGLLHHVTVSANASGSPAGVWLNQAATARNTIIAGNGSGAECGGYGAFTAEGVDLQDAGGACFATGSHSITTASPGLLALAANGAATRTHALSAGSPAIDGGTDCTLTTDQRGSSRPVGASCDIGAYEGSVAAAAPILSTGGPGTVAVGGGTFTITAQAFNGTGGALSGVSLELEAPAPATVAGGTTRSIGSLAVAQSGSGSWTVTTPDVCNDTELSLRVLADWSGRGGARPSSPVPVTALGHCAQLGGAVRDHTGTRVAGAVVTLCPVPEGACLTATSDVGGAYAIAGIEPGTYQLAVRPSPDVTDESPFTWGRITFDRNGHVTQDLAFSTRRTAGAVGTTISVSNGRVTPDGTPSIPRTGTTFRWNGTNCADSPRVQFTIADGVETFFGPQDMHAVNPGTIPTIWEIDVPHLDRGGWATIRLTITCFGHPGGVVILDTYIDPSGFVRDTAGNPLPGATVTLYSAPSAAGPWTAVPDGSTIMSPNNRKNPDTTTATGYFGWDVAPGFYKVVAEKAGCGSVESRVMQVPPPVTDLDLRLACGSAATSAAPAPTGGGGGGGAAPASAAAAPAVSAAAAPTAPARAALALTAGAARLHAGRVTATLRLSAPAEVTVRVLHGGKAVTLARGSTVGGLATGRARTAITAHADGAVALALRVGSLSGPAKLVATATGGGVTRTVAIAVKR